MVALRARSRFGAPWIGYCILLTVNRRMKCDEGRPSCKNCIHRPVSCPGYTPSLEWSKKHERRGQQASSSGRHGSATSTSAILALRCNAAVQRLEAVCSVTEGPAATVSPKTAGLGRRPDPFKALWSVLMRIWLCYTRSKTKVIALK